jgi:putative ABC transport system permease protein
VKAYDLSELAVRNLRESLLRNSLTTVGISVGVASLVAMLALGIGLQQLASRRLAKSGLFDTVVVTSRRDLRFNREQEENGPSPAESPALDEAARQKLAALPNVSEAFPDIRFITVVQMEGKSNLTLVAGLPYSAKGSDALEGLQGSFFSSDTAAEAIVQKSFAAQLLGRKPPKVGEPEINAAEVAPLVLGKELVMRYAERVVQSSQGGAPGEPGGAAYSVVSHTQTLKIVGVTDLDPDSMRGMAQARVFLPLRFAQSLHVMQANEMRGTGNALDGAQTYLRVSVRVSNPKYVQSVEDSIKKLGFNTFSIVDATKGLRQFFAVLDLFLGIFGSLALAVASIGIVNTLVMAILERRREIGIMKAIGASDTDVKRLFFAEAGVMGLFGGAVGVALGWTIGRVINLGANIYLKRQHFPPEQIWSVPWWLVLGAIGFSLVISLISGLYPAARAARLDPVQALRYE